MEPWYPFVIGTVIFGYIQSFNRITKIYVENGKTLEWRDFFTVVLPVQNVRND
jgi:hypothetical protein